MSGTIVVTGASAGIGRGVARRFLAEGWNVALLARRSEVLREVADGAPNALPVVCDVSDAGAVDAAFGATIERFGRIDALVNNAGITSPGRKDILEADEESFDKVMGINLKGPFFLTQLAARRMAAQDNSDGWRGKVVFVSSISAEFVSVNRGDYCLTKAALGMATKLWATRLAEHHIDVYEVRPGVIRSDMTAGVTDKYDKLFSEGLTLDRRWGEPSDVGKAIRVLLDGELPYATGQVLKIDGGMTIHSL